MSDNPLFQARQAELAKRRAFSKDETKPLVVEKEQQLKALKEEAKKAKKAVDKEPSEDATSAEPDPVEDTFPPVIENKAMEPEEVKEETKEDEETL